MGEFSMEFDVHQVVLYEKYPDGNVKQQFRVPMGEVPGLVASLDGAMDHIHHEHHAHGQEGH